MAKFQKQKLPATQKQSKSKNTLNDPDERKKFKAGLATITHHFQLIDDQKEAIKEIIEELSENTGLDKKLVRKLAATIHKHNYSSLQQENEHFSILYETVVEGRLLNAPDPLDRKDEEDEETE